MRKREFSYAILLSLMYFSVYAKDQQSTNATRRAIFTTKAATATAGADAETERRRKRNCFSGCPKLERDRFDFGASMTISREGYVLESSLVDKIPFWVAEFVTTEQLSGNVPRVNKFRPDPEIPVGERAELIDYRGSGFDRGHQAPAGNQTTDEQLKVETFFLSNIAPQVPALNQQIWRELEDKTREWTEARGESYQLTGGMFYDPAEEDAETADGVVDFETIGPGRVAVPTHFYKIIVAKNPETHIEEAMAFVAENEAYERPFDFEGLLVAIDWIEERTGIDFFPNLSEAEEARLERNPAPALWPTQ